LRISAGKNNTESKRTKRRKIGEHNEEIKDVKEE
jgi:hypothetical protein